MNPAFNGDHFIEFELNYLVKKWSIQTIIETGTYRGGTTQALAKLGPDVVTIEIDWERFTFATELDKIRHVTRFHGDSPAVLRRILGDIARPVLFYLDAHWAAHSPLLDELSAIARAQSSSNGAYPVIAIHDFFNPAHPDYAYDRWDIGEYRLALVTELLNAIYGAGNWRHYFNDESAAEPKRGILYVEPCG